MESVRLGQGGAPFQKNEDKFGKCDFFCTLGGESYARWKSDTHVATFLGLEASTPCSITNPPFLYMYNVLPPLSTFLRSYLARKSRWHTKREESKRRKKQRIPLDS